ncbi:hypothetical protein DK846_08785 [Methanospirillum lacunae]|uniref:Uncharacterized protein n=1 Tax=Methanospirillum lacunae TaxID=668570 RepID=A0A2V2N0J0_9EURY|nr:hypothetical protein DK846_08785 [Methanospirillum lacunae]
MIGELRYPEWEFEQDISGLMRTDLKTDTSGLSCDFPRGLVGVLRIRLDGVPGGADLLLSNKEGHLLLLNRMMISAGFFWGKLRLKYHSIFDPVA